jgi:hypothetical protein
MESPRSNLSEPNLSLVRPLSGHTMRLEALSDSFRYGIGALLEVYKAWVVTQDVCFVHHTKILLINTSFHYQDT